MKKKFTLMMAALTLLVFMMPTMAGWGQTRDTKTDIMFAKGFGGYTNNSYSAAGTDRTAVANSTNATGVTYAMQVFNGSQGTVRGNQSGAANYSCRNTTTYNDYYISSVTLTITGGTLRNSNGRSLVYFGSSAYANPNTTAPTGTSTTASLSSDSKTLTWTNTDESVSHFILYNLETSGNCYSADADSPLTVVWTSKTPASSVATPQLSKGTSYCDEAQSITITCDTDGATIHYTLDGTDPTSESTTYSEAISITTTTTLKAIAIKGSGSSAVASATYTIVNTLKTMEAIYAAANAAGNTPTTVYIHFNNWVISGVNGGSSPTVAYLTDGEKGCEIYKYGGHGFVTGNVLNGIASCSLKLQYTMAYITDLTSSSEGLEVSDGGAVTPVVKTIDALSGINTGSVVRINGLTWNSSTSTFSDGTYTISNSNNISNQTSLLTNGQVFDITGVFDMADGPVKRINPRSSNDVVEGPTTLPFNWAGGSSADLKALQGVTTSTLSGDYAAGNSPYLVKFDADGKYIVIRTNEQIGTVTVGIKKIGGSGNSSIKIQGSVDGTDYSDIQTFNNSGDQNDILSHTTTNSIASTYRYVKILFVKPSGGANVGVGPITIAAPSDEPSITVDSEKNINYDVTSESISCTINNPVDGGSLSATSSESWLIIGTVTSSAVPFTCSANNTNTPRSATVTLTYTYGDSQTTTATVEVTQSGVPCYYALAKSIIPGKRYIITNGSDKAMGVQNTKNRAAANVTISNGIATVTNNDVYEFTVATSGNYYSIYDYTASSGYLYAASSSENQLKTDADLDNNGKWSIIIDQTNGIATVIAQGDNTRNVMRYNDGSTLFSCYASGQNVIYLYMKVDTYLTADGNWSDGTKWIKGTVPTSSNDVAINAACTIPSDGIAQASNIIIAGSSSSLTIEDGGQLICNNSVEATFNKNITAASTTVVSDENWYLISSPVGTVNTSDVTNLLGSGDHKYNLYKFNETSAAWNGNGGGNHFETLAKGMGYLYRNNDGADLSFTGTTVTGDYEYDVELTRHATALPGFNLLGNPYSHNITSKYITLDKGAEFNGCYVLKTDGTWTSSLDNVIKPGEGFFVQVSADETTATFHETAQRTGKYNEEYIQFMVSNNDYEDVTFALFDKGIGLKKIDHRNSDVQMVYIKQNNEDYAIATMSDDTKSFDLCFKSKTIGQYTLKYKTHGEFNYIHVIDRMTGEDIDMLVEGEYKFISAPKDSENRFIVKLGYLPDYSDVANDIFAFHNGSEILVSGEGELQIFDVTGRNVMTTTINGAESINIPTQGVYIFRLVGTEVKTQKIVVR